MGRSPVRRRAFEFEGRGYPGVMSEPRWLDPEEMRAWQALLSGWALLEREIDQQLRRDSGLSHTQYEVLVRLSDTPEGRLRMTELAEVLEARQRWFADGDVLSEQLSPDLWARLQGKFSFVESGVATLTCLVSDRGGEIQREARVPRDCRSPGAYADPGRKMLAYWEKVVY